MSLRTFYLLVAAMFCECSLTNAAIIEIENVSLQSQNQTQIQTADVFFATDPSLPFDLSAYQLKIDLVGGQGEVAISGFGPPSQSHPYVFTNSAPIGSISNGGLTLELGDFLNSGFSTVDGNEGIAIIQVTVGANVSGNYQFNISLNPNESFLANSQSQFVPFTTQGGQISVAAVPEPTSIIALIGGCTIYLRRRSNRHVSDTMA